MQRLLLGVKRSLHHVSGYTVICSKMAAKLGIPSQIPAQDDSTAPDQALRLEECVSALVLAGEEDHMAGFGILPVLRLWRV